MYNGKKTYKENAKKLVESVKKIKDFIGSYPELKVLVDPKINCLAFTFKENPEKIYYIDNIMKEKGWHLTATHKP